MKAKSDLVIRQMRWHANMTELNHLGRSLIAKPERLTGTMLKIFSSYRYSQNPLTSMLSGTGREKLIGSNEWEWDLRGATTRPLVIVENVLPSGITKPGEFNTPFDMKFDESWWLPGDYIHPGTSNKKYMCRIQEGPIPHGNGYIYKVQLATDDQTEYLPTTYLAPNTKWAKIYSQYEEGSVQAGSMQYFLPQTLKSRLSLYRKHFQVTDQAHDQVLAVAIPDDSGKYHNMWLKYAETEFWEQFYREIERGLWYSRSSNKIQGSTGRPVYSGPGVQELLENSHVHKYTQLTADLLEEFVTDIFYSRVTPGPQRRLKAYTGEWGMVQFHRAVQSKANNSGFFQVVDDLLVRKHNSPYHENGLSFGAQYTEYKMANGAVLELVHNPIYDDREVNFEIDTVTGYPFESQRFTFLDFSGEGTESNIQLVRKKNGMKSGYVPGLVSPYGQQNNGLMAHDGAFYKVHAADQCGIHIEDTSRCGELILERS